MSDIQKAFENGKAFIAFITCGDPDLETTAAAVKAAQIVKKLRDRGINAESDIMGRSLKAQMKYADKIGARFTLILGDSEIESGRANIKEMATSEQTEVSLDGIGAFLDGKRA